MLKIFTEGVNLLECFTKQQRIRQGNNFDKKFIFHPTWMGTSSVFKFIDQHRSNPIQLIAGSPGIGKTASMILYCLLMENVVSYAIKKGIDEELKKNIK